MKQAVLEFMRTAGVFAPFRMANRGKALVITYHRFSEDEAEQTTSARVFASQLEYLQSHYKIVPLSELADCLNNGRAPQPGTVAITIDDGYSDAYTVAFPILQRYKAPATVFVVTDFLDRKAWLWTDKLRYLTSRTEARRFEVTIRGTSLIVELAGRATRLQAATRINSLLKRLPDDEKDETILRLSGSLCVPLPELPPDEFSPLSWERAREMDSAGVEVGSHTITHPILTNVSDERLQSEIGGARERLLSALGREADLFCYPNGGYDERVRREVQRAGYRCAVTTRVGFNDEKTDPLALNRIHTERDLNHFVQSTSGFEQVKNRLRNIRANTARASAR